METLAPFEILYDSDSGAPLELPPEIAMLYGKLEFPTFPGKSHVVGNFVETLDGVVSLDIPGIAGGGEISGHNQYDRVLMGILRAWADAVVVGAGTLRAVPMHLWTAEHIFPQMSETFQTMRKLSGKSSTPLNVIVTGSGDIDPKLPVFTTGNVPVLVVTNRVGLEEIHKRPLSPSVHVEAVANEGRVKAQQVLDAITRLQKSEKILVEGGPQLIGDFLAEDMLDELFLTLSPQIAGSDESHPRPKLVEGHVFAPDQPKWANLVSVRRGGSHLFLRYAFQSLE